MKKLILTAACALLTLTAFGQAKKPTIMVVPSDVWCNQNGFTTAFDNQGVIERQPDYAAALASDENLVLAISKLGEMMSERGFPLKDLGASLRTLRNQDAERALIGDQVAESPIERLKSVASADIWIHLTYTLTKTGPNSQITFNMQGFDAYTDKQIAAASGTGKPSFSAIVPVLLEEAVLTHIDTFNYQLQNYFDDLFENGREVKLTLRRTNDSPYDFESEVGGDELGFAIEDWVASNTVGGRFSTAQASENIMVFEQVRIPMIDERGNGLDTRGWARGLVRYLRSQGIDTDLRTQGLGHVIITLE